MDLNIEGTAAEGAIDTLFKGQMKSYIKCNNIDYESSRIEDYYGKYFYFVNFKVQTFS
jgi:ubiquitin carboxyl-terminal hydrolase 7